MLDDLRGLLDGFVAAEGWFAGAASALAFLAFLVEFVRGRAAERSFRPLIGWTTVVLGALAAAAAAHALFGHRSPHPGPHWLLTSILVVGAAMIVAGVLAVALAPGANRTQLRQIAAVVDGTVPRSDFPGSLYVPMRFRKRTGAAWLGESGEVSLRRLDAVKLPTASVAVLAGPTNSGKSVELGHLVMNMCNRARQHGRPRELAIYVAIHRLPTIEEPIVVDTIRDHLLASIAQQSTALGTVVGEYLDSGTGPRWLLAFDLGAELTRDQEVQYFEALRNFMRHRDRDRAIVAVREEFPDANVVLTPQPPDLRMINSMLQRQGIATKVKPPLAEWRLAPAFADPAMITCFGPRLVNADQKSVRDIVESFLTEQLGRHTAIDTSIQSRRERAEDVAYRILFGGPNDPVTNEEAAPLVAANLVRAEHGAFAFRFPIAGVHLAAARLIRDYQSIPLTTLLRTETTRAVLTTALQHADEQFVRHIVGQIERLAEPTDDDSSGTTLPPLGSFRWPQVVLRALTVLRDLDRRGRVPELSPAGRAVVDRLLWRAVLGGGRRDREVALTLLALASPERVLDLYRQAVSLGYDDRTTTIIAIFVRFNRGRHPVPTAKERLSMIDKAAVAWQSGTLPLHNVPADGYGLLRPLLDKFVFAVRVCYAGGAILSAWSALTANTLADRAMVAVVAVLLAFVCWWLRGGAASIEKRRTNALVVMVLIAAVLSAFVVPFVIILGWPLNFTDAIIKMLLVFVFSWPLCVGLAILRHPMTQPSWWFPQKIVAELVRDRAELRPYAVALVSRFDRVRKPWRWGRARATPIDVVRRAILDRPMTETALLDEFAERANRGYNEFSQLIKVLAAIRPGMLRESVHVLQALDELLEYFERTLPPPARRSNARIKPDMWRYAPASDPAGLREWAETTDRTRPGLLLRLANADTVRKMLAGAIENATTEITPEVLSPTEGTPAPHPAVRAGDPSPA